MGVSCRSVSHGLYYAIGAYEHGRLWFRCSYVVFLYMIIRSIYILMKSEKVE